MNLAAFDYPLPAERIAQEPVTPRDAARLLVHHVPRASTLHLCVRDLPERLRAGDLLVVNDARVRPARLFARRASGGRVELLVLGPAAPPSDAPERRLWSAMARPGKRLRPGEVLAIEGGGEARLAGRRGDGRLWTLEFREEGEPRELELETLLERAGRMPLPPYVLRAPGGDPRDALDRERYQTIWARVDGAVAAPTAGLHFTPELVSRLEQAGIALATVTLHVGAGTFQPVTAERVEEHVMHAEDFELPEPTARAVAECRARGGRVVAVGTTSLRVLESRADERGRLESGAGSTRLFVTPGHRFRAVDALLTNFHLPRSTPLLLAAAFAGAERLLGLYREALERGYRFASYGDAMLLESRD